jgi:hypothetical protein
MLRTILSNLATIAILCGAWLSAADCGEKQPVKVFILAGQSNMQGHGHLKTIDWLGKDPRYGHLLKKIKNDDGSFVVRKDVWITYPARKKHGPLTVGYGVSDNHIGPDVMFGSVMGDHYENQVLLIKTAWGGRSVGKDFRPPSSGGEVGATYKEMIAQIKDALANLKTEFPAYQGQGYEIVGFVWFQGWNDMINKDFTAEYTKNLANLIRDVRKELDAPRMKVVIGELGVGGDFDPSDNIKKFRKAQAAVAEIPEFKGNVVFVPTAQYWDVKAHEFLNKNWVKRKWVSEEAKAEFETMGTQPPYHYLGSARIYSLIGHGLGESMRKQVSAK